MRNVVCAAAAALLISTIYVSAGAQGRGGQTFPNRQRELADAATSSAARRSTASTAGCAMAPDLRGGDMGGINLLRSALVLNDQDGELIFPVVRDGRNRPGMPPMPPLPLPEDDVKAIAAYIHSVMARSPARAARRQATGVELNIVVGDAAAGQKYFAANCASCHSPTGDLRGARVAISEPDAAAERVGRRVPAAAAAAADAAVPRAAEHRRRRACPKPVTVTVTTADGQTHEGRLDRIDDFIVTLTQADGMRETFRRNGSVPAVQITDPLDGAQEDAGEDTPTRTSTT